MTYKQIETSREIRQWIKALTPIIGGIIYIDWKYPYLKNELVERFKSKFRRRKNNEES